MHTPYRICPAIFLDAEMLLRIRHCAAIASLAIRSIRAQSVRVDDDRIAMAEMDQLLWCHACTASRGPESIYARSFGHGRWLAFLETGLKYYPKPLD